MTTPLQLFTIGFTRKSAEAFFSTLQREGVRRIVDVRLNNTGQLAGFTKRDDLSFFLRSFAGIEYVHLTILAPTPDMLHAYRNDRNTWEAYAAAFARLLDERQIETALRSQIQTGDCLLCSEPTADRCHRRIVAEYLQKHWEHVRIKHL